MEVSTPDTRVLIKISRYNFSGFYQLNHNIQVLTELIIVKSYPRPFLRLKWLQSEIELPNGGHIILPTKVFLNWCQYNTIKCVIMTGHMVNFFIKHYDLMRPVIFKENQEVVSTPVKSV